MLFFLPLKSRENAQLLPVPIFVFKTVTEQKQIDCGVSDTRSQDWTVQHQMGNEQIKLLFKNRILCRTFTLRTMGLHRKKKSEEKEKSNQEPKQRLQHIFNDTDLLGHKYPTIENSENCQSIFWVTIKLSFKLNSYYFYPQIYDYAVPLLNWN